MTNDIVTNDAPTVVFSFNLLLPICQRTVCLLVIGHYVIGHWFYPDD